MRTPHLPSNYYAIPHPSRPDPSKLIPDAGAVAGNAAAFISTPAAAGYGKTFCSKGRIATGGASSSTCSCALSDDDRSNLPLSSDLFFSSRGRRWLTEFPTAAATATVVGGGHRRGLRALGLSKVRAASRVQVNRAQLWPCYKAMV